MKVGWLIIAKGTFDFITNLKSASYREALEIFWCWGGFKIPKVVWFSLMTARADFTISFLTFVIVITSAGWVDFMWACITEKSIFLPLVSLPEENFSSLVQRLQ
jgi:hypothetical protein